MKTNVSDEDLWLALLKGDRSALNLIYEQNFGPLYQYGLRILQDEDAINDCLHDLFLKLWTNRSNLGTTNNIRYYLISSLRNGIINYKVQETRFNKVELQDKDVFDLKFTVESEYINKEEQTEKNAQLAAAMNQLTARQKEIIYLRYYEELEFGQIAEVMNLTKKGAYKLSARALEALREILNVDKAVMLAMLMAIKH